VKIPWEIFNFLLREGGDSVDALGKLYTSTAIVTMNVDGKMNGITVAWLTRVSWDPPMIAISIGKTRYSHELLLKSQGFAVCIMGEEGREAAEYFGTVSGRDVDKFKKFKYQTTKGGYPIPEGTIAYLECRITGKCEAGDHTIFIGHVEHQEVLKDEKPLIFGEHTIL